MRSSTSQAIGFTLSLFGGLAGLVACSSSGNSGAVQVTTGGTSGTGGSTNGTAGSGGGDCTDGAVGCQCYPNDTCGAGLVCRSGLCAEPDPGSAGQSGTGGAGCTQGSPLCACYPNDSCDAGLVCRSGLCAEPDPGSAGQSGTGGAGCTQGSLLCACYPNLTCNTGLVCLSGACVEPGTGGQGGTGGLTGGTGADTGGTGGLTGGTGGDTGGTGGDTGGTGGLTGGTGGDTGGTGGLTGGTGGDTGGTGGLTGGTGGLTGGTGGDTGGTGGLTGGTGGMSCAAEANYPNLVNSTGWVGCDQSLTSDNPQGIQGAFYLYGDGLTCAPATGNPCSTGSCCLPGTTIVDTTYASWGCGIGLELNSDGTTPSTKSAYGETYSCFTLAFSGTSGGNTVQVAFTQSASPNISPFVDIGAVNSSASYTVCFGNVSCPTWASATECSKTWNEYDLQIQVVGGERSSSFNLCLASLTVT